ncbi:hypothetical protein NIES2100_06410 [Calothrix sp. NIES-2100]|uniref:hypothetical protein n=1 Tax=Calothrix sp. NIES-2100 TaxID=1954172 RepID=UPI000B5E0A2C|nr:hypothetical protein NIES2100_06410 [Calothrix sp. NIES-2100]
MQPTTQLCLVVYYILLYFPREQLGSVLLLNGCEIYFSSSNKYIYVNKLNYINNGKGKGEMSDRAHNQGIKINTQYPSLF